MTKTQEGKIVKISGPVIIADGMRGAKMYDVVRVGKEGLIGEVIKLEGSNATVQVYEETAGIGPGEKVVNTGAPLSVELGPGLIGTTYDGIARPLKEIKEKIGPYITRGIEIPTLDRKKKWGFTPKVKNGDTVQPGDIVGVVNESSLVEHRVLVPPGMNGKITKISANGSYTVEHVVARVGDADVKMYQVWPVREQRRYKTKLEPNIPLITGQRIHSRPLRRREDSYPAAACQVVRR